ncbi:MAG: DUF169 domain-containing protein [Candidatus Bathyarchaeia archaeon]|jgi:uncharacterized protein (DUF169 family)|nr:hypothetical protein [Candidatus Bathyarchaeota archaeon A05DMB-4]MDH7594670.1 DUF169 domain-containing protein [Candidatus Bathyarchaeota archaeon]
MTRIENTQTASSLKEILNLKWSPIAVKIVKEDTNPENIPTPSTKKLRYCQLLMEAKKGKSATLTKENIACPAAAAALGLLPLPEKISSGEMLKALGLFDAKEARAREGKNYFDRIIIVYFCQPLGLSSHPYGNFSKTFILARRFLSE